MTKYYLDRDELISSINEYTHMLARNPKDDFSGGCIAGAMAIAQIVERANAVVLEGVGDRGDG